MLTTAMKNDSWLRGIIYYIGTFGPLWTSWETSMFFESRYTTVDYAHRLYEVVRYMLVSPAVIHVKSMELLSDPKSAETLLFTSAILGESMMHFLLNVELYRKGVGDVETIRMHTLMQIKFQHVPVMLVYTCAVVAAGIMFARPLDDGEEENATVGAGRNEQHRFLAETKVEYDEAAIDHYDNKNVYGEGLWLMSDLPLTLTAFGYLQNIVMNAFCMSWATSGKFGDIRRLFVPNNVDYVIHRYGEWILLMIGESILSLLIVETAEVQDYYIIATFGVLTVISIQILKFESEPSHRKYHAMWRNLLNGMCYSYLIQALSVGLILFGVTYKIFLKDVLKEAEQLGNSHYGHSEAGYNYEANLADNSHGEADYGHGEDDSSHGEGGSSHRALAASLDIPNRLSARLFSGALFFVLLSLELMCLTHAGIRKAAEHLVIRDRAGRTTSPHWPVVIISLFKVAIMCFTVTLYVWTIDPDALAICGFFIVFAMAITRIMNFFFINKKGFVSEMLG